MLRVDSVNVDTDTEADSTVAIKGTKLLGVTKDSKVFMKAYKTYIQQETIWWELNSTTVPQFMLFWFYSITKVW